MTAIKIVTVRTGETLIENISLEVDVQESVTVKSTTEGVQATPSGAGSASSS